MGSINYSYYLPLTALRRSSKSTRHIQLSLGNLEESCICCFGRGKPSILPISRVVKVTEIAIFLNILLFMPDCVCSTGAGATEINERVIIGILGIRSS